MICDESEIEIDTPRDRDGTFEPQLIKKNQTRITGMDEQIIALYAKGLSNQEIVEISKERYNADVSTSLISRVTDSVKKRVLEWQNRPLDAVYPQTKIQLCIVHFVRNSLKYVSWKDYKAVTADLKQAYQAPTEAQARKNLTALSQKWQEKYPLVVRGWEENWANIATFFGYPPDIRKAIYTTNAVESLNSVIRRVIKKRNVFPTDDSVFKVIWLAMKEVSKKWMLPIQNWKQAMNRFMIDFGDRLNDHR
ncbi:Transposase and inactivated derivatives [[Pasteurella] mairii]|uniref:Mutator family transposase n=1 Tax=[Pasteurella] mairii TaxID=757 RepID=A0A379B834_9PAST|nr:Transposase and inactivated derivatives [[Pasteurella] mairii]